MTTATEAIVTALGEGPATARDLSQRLDGIGYANIRQGLRRLAAAGTVTKVQRGLYAVGAADCDASAPEPEPCERTSTQEAPHRRRVALTAEEWSQALASLWGDFDAMNDPFDPRPGHDRRARSGANARKSQAAGDRCPPFLFSLWRGAVT
ncbi:MAG TPA: winged helix-turn-helix domain-containing protein [Thermohalobaculum sp.]|nr:winged helix-turn-helix domain-containing protein [Thermohalobaculum sp.]